MRRRRRPGGMHRLGIVLVLLATACGGPVDRSSTDPSGDPAGTWQLVAGTANDTALPVPAEHPITLTLEPSRMGGTAACNSYGAEFSLTGDGIQMGPIDQTLRGCEQALEDAEAAYLSVLRTVTRIGLDGEHLVLTGSGVELRFERLSEAPTAELVGTTWTLETLLLDDEASAPMGEPATLELRADGTFSGSTGCRPFDGQWIEQGEQLLATTFAMGDVACPAELADQDNRVVTVIGDGFVPSIENGLLTLSDPGGMGLVYRSSE